MQDTDSLLSPGEGKQASVKTLSWFQELDAENQSSSSSTECNKMTEQDVGSVVALVLD